MKFLHLNDSATQQRRGEPGYDKLYKIRPFIDTILTKFKAAYIPFQNISIDESIIGFKGRLSFIQYMPKKPHKWGIKAWVLADALNGYTWGWKLYTGKEGDVVQHGLAHKVVLELTDDERLKGRGYVVFTDNFYSSPPLFRELSEEGFGAVGTVRLNRKGVPMSVRSAILQKGGVVSEVDDGGVMALKWKDKRDVAMLSTYHNSEMIVKQRRSRKAEGGLEEIRKPVVVEDYNQNMGGVDKSKLLHISTHTHKHTHTHTHSLIHR